MKKKNLGTKNRPVLSEDHAPVQRYYPSATERFFCEPWAEDQDFRGLQKRRNEIKKMERAWISAIEACGRSWKDPAEDLQLVRCADELESEEITAAVLWETLRHLYYCDKFPQICKNLVMYGHHEWAIIDDTVLINGERWVVPNSSEVMRFFDSRYFPVCRWLQLPSSERLSIAASLNWKLAPKMRLLSSKEASGMKSWLEAATQLPPNKPGGVNPLEWLQSCPPLEYEHFGLDEHTSKMIVQVDWRFSEDEIGEAFKNLLRERRGDRKKKSGAGKPPYLNILKGLALMRRMDGRGLMEKEAVDGIFKVKDQRNTFSGAARTAYTKAFQMKSFLQRELEEFASASRQL